MNKLVLHIIFCILFSFSAVAQSYEYAVVTDLNYSPEKKANLKTLITELNENSKIDFVIFQGSLSFRGSENQFSDVKSALDSLVKPYYLLPGKNDFAWAENEDNYLSSFRQKNFLFLKDSVLHLGINTNSLWNSTGHIAKEELSQIKSSLKKITQFKKAVVYFSHPLIEVDNWKSVFEVIPPQKLLAVISLSYGRQDFSIFEGINLVSVESSFNEKNKSYSYNVFEIRNDSLLIKEILKNGNEKLRGIAVNSAQFDSSLIINKGITQNRRIIYEVNLNHTVTSPLIYEDGKIYTATANGNIYCLDSTGKILWHYNTGEQILTKMVVVDDNLIAGSLQGDLFSIDTKTGKLNQVIGIGESITTDINVLKLMSGRQKISAIILGTSNGNLFCYDSKYFEPVWENNSAEGMIYPDVSVLSDRIVFKSADNNLYCINAASGILNWKYFDKNISLNLPSSTAIVANNKFIFLSTYDKLSAIDLLLGTKVWEQKKYINILNLSLMNENKIFTNNNKYFYVLNASNGRLYDKIKIEQKFNLTNTRPVLLGNDFLYSTFGGSIFYSNSKQVIEKIIEGEEASVTSIVKLKTDLFAAANTDGKIFYFKLK